MRPYLENPKSSVKVPSITSILKKVSDDKTLVLFLTMLGKVVYESQMIIGKTLAYYWKLKAIESLDISTTSGPLSEEMTQLINALIDNHQIKDILMKLPLNSSV